jgi:flagellar protein FliO/FliZ
MDWARAAFALMATLALILGVAWGARRLGMLQANMQAARRMRVSESLMIDPRRRLVIVRCDDREHLILCGPGGDVVVSEMAAKADAATVGGER